MRELCTTYTQIGRGRSTIRSAAMDQYIKLQNLWCGSIDYTTYKILNDLC